MKRRRFKQVAKLEERLGKQANRFRAEAKGLPPSPERENLLRLARQADTASQMSAWPRWSGPR